MQDRHGEEVAVAIGGAAGDELTYRSIQGARGGSEQVASSLLGQHGGGAGEGGGRVLALALVERVDDAAVFGLVV